MSERAFENCFSSLLAALDEFRNTRDISEVRDIFLTLFILRFLSFEHHSINLPQKARIDSLLAKGETGIYERLKEALTEIEDENPNLQGVLRIYNPINIESQRHSDEKQLCVLLEKLNHITFGENLEVFQYAYDRLIAYFAENSKKTAPNFYSPAVVANLIADLLSPQAGMSIYDPVCGSGGFLLAAATRNKQQNTNKKSFTLVGQDVNSDSWRIAKQNMLIHGFLHADIKQGNVLDDPLNIDQNGQLKTFDIVVANPPFSTKHRIEPDHRFAFERFSYGLPPLQNADYAFIQHMLASLKNGGHAAIIVPDGVLFRGAAEKKIRQSIIEAHNVEAVISLPPNLFHGTTIPTNILVLRKKTAGNDVLFIDAREQLTEKGKRQKSIDQSTLDKITAAFKTRKNIEGFSRAVSLKEVSENDFNLTVSRYIRTVSAEKNTPTSVLIQKQIELETQLRHLQADMKGLFGTY